MAEAVRLGPTVYKFAFVDEIAIRLTMVYQVCQPIVHKMETNTKRKKKRLAYRQEVRAASNTNSV
jgi:hypothetical protein